MGEAKRRQYSRADFLLGHPTCCYCGSPATTTDHCPPKSMFLQRNWPEGFEFPACAACNEEGRSYEQVIGVVLRLSPLNNVPESELRRICTGVRNNHPEIVEEWLSGSLFWQANALDRIPGDLGRVFRRQGMKSLKMGPLTWKCIDLFGLKLAKAQFYKHTGSRLRGVVFCKLLSLFQSEDTFKNLLPLVPHLPKFERARKKLHEQFFYRCNFSVEHGAFMSLSLFNGQFGYVNLAFENTFYELDVCNKPELLAKITDALGSPRAVE